MAANSSKRVTNFAQAMTYSIIVIAILAAVNYLANRYNKSVDTTANKRYTLSDQTSKIAGDLKQDVTITYWNRPEQFLGARDLLDRYANLSPRMKVVYRDIDKDRPAAIAAGVSAVGATMVETGNKKEQAKSLTEEEVTGAIVRVLKGGDRQVCFTSGYGEGALDDTNPEGYSGVKELIERNLYKTQVVPLIPIPSIPKECTVLVVGGPKRNYLQPAIDAIKNFVEGGGHAIVMLDPPLKFGSQVDENENFVKVLETWGIVPARDLVLDLQGEREGLGAGFAVSGDYGDHAITRPLKARRIATVFPISRSLQAAPGGAAEIAPLVLTGPVAIRKTDLSNPNVPDGATPEGKIPLSMVGTLREGAKGRFVMVGTSGWIDNSTLGLTGNRDLFLNMVNWLSSDEDLISIRPKDPEDRRLNMNQRQLNLMFFGSVLGIPALMFLAGFSVWWRRR